MRLGFVTRPSPQCAFAEGSALARGLQHDAADDKSLANVIAVLPTSRRIRASPGMGGRWNSCPAFVVSGRYRSRQVRVRVAQAVVSIALVWLGLSPAIARATQTCGGVSGPVAVWAHGVSCRFAVRFVNHVDTLQLYLHPRPYTYRGYRCGAYRRGIELYSHCQTGQRVIRFETGP